MARRGTLQVRIIGDAKPLQRTLGRAGPMLTKFAAAGVAAVAGLAAFSIKRFADFDQAMTRSTAIMGDLSEAMRRDMADAAREVATTTAFSATEAAESYFFLASAGMDAAESIEALPKVAAFAQAANADMARATDLLTDAQSALGLTSDRTAESMANMTRVSDTLVRANTLANASVEEFSEALTQKAGAALRDLNKDVEEGVAVLAVYADQGRKGSEAGTLLNATLEGLTRTARDQAGAYERLGVEVFDSSGEMRNMADIVGGLEAALAGMSTEQRLAELAGLGLTRQARDGVIALLDNADAIGDYEAALRDAAGTTQEVADNQLDTFWGQLGLLRDQLGDVALSVGEALMPALERLVGWFQEQTPFLQAVAADFADAMHLLFGGTRDEVEETERELGRGVDQWARHFDTGLATMNEAMDGWHIKMEETSGAVVSDFTRISDFVEETLLPAFEDIADWWERNGEDVQDAMRAVGTTFVFVGQVIAVTARGIVRTFDWMYRNITIPTGIAMAMFLGTWRARLRRWKQIVAERIAEVVLLFQRLPESIRRALFSGRPFRNFGREMMGGIIRGVGDRVGALTSAVENAAKSALRSAKNVLGISSPSVVFAAEVGAPMMDGVIEGLQQEASRLARVQMDLLVPDRQVRREVARPDPPAPPESNSQPDGPLVAELSGEVRARFEDDGGLVLAFERSQLELARRS